MVATRTQRACPGRVLPIHTTKQTGGLYRDEMARRQYLEFHPVAGPMDSDGCWILCLACVRRKDRILYPCYIQLDARKGTRYDLTAWNKHCQRRHKQIDDLWNSSMSKKFRKVPRQWDDKLLERFQKYIVPELREKRRKRELRQRRSLSAISTITSEHSSTSALDADDIHPETGVSYGALNLLSKLLRASHL
ncbi:hypothetical protein BJ165DRAFT_1611877 [Panaeolus papilionaceus]|nr:hypothetical protein BJ165DRAFT_1611877 [Panaeolus papilionaceus]